MIENDRDNMKLLIGYKISKETAAEAKKVLSSCADLTDSLVNPEVTQEEKNRIIDKVFPTEITAAIKKICENGEMKRLSDILDEYINLCIEKQGSIKAVVRYVNELSDDQIKDLKGFIMEKFNRTDVDFEYKGT